MIWYLFWLFISISQSQTYILLFIMNRISDVMVSVLTSSVVGRGFKFWSGQTKNLENRYLLPLLKAHSI